MPGTTPFQPLYSFSSHPFDTGHWQLGASGSEHESGSSARVSLVMLGIAVLECFPIAIALPISPSGLFVATGFSLVLLAPLSSDCWPLHL